MTDKTNIPRPTSNEPLDRGLYDWASRELQRYIATRLMRSGNGTADTKDLLSIVFERYWKSRRDLVRNPVPYLIRIAENVLNEFLLRQSRSPITFDSRLAAEALTDQSEIPVWGDQLLDQIASEQQLKRVLAQIPPYLRAVLILRTRDDLSDAEIARKLGISEGTARIYFQRALAACRAADWDR